MTSSELAIVNEYRAAHGLPPSTVTPNDKDESLEYSCPSCGKFRSYTTKSCLNRTKRKNLLCISCARGCEEGLFIPLD